MDQPTDPCCFPPKSQGRPNHLSSAFGGSSGQAYASPFVFVRDLYPTGLPTGSRLICTSYLLRDLVKSRGRHRTQLLSTLRPGYGRTIRYRPGLTYLLMTSTSRPAPRLGPF